MQIRKYRWSRVYESNEEELQDWLASKKFEATRWAAGEGEVLTPPSQDANKRLYCAEGLLTVTAGGKTFSLQPGDALDLPAATSYEVRVGFGGCVCYESSLVDLASVSSQPSS